MMVSSHANCRYWLLLAVSMLVGSLPVLAQSNPYFSTTDSSLIDSTGAYWKLRTDYKTRTTHIQFFNAERQVIYEEKLSGRYVKLTRRNVRLFDELLDRLANRRLLDYQIESHDLLASNSAQFTRSAGHSTPTTTVLEASSLPKEDLTFSANSVITDLGKLVLYCTNPEHIPIYITLTDDAQEMEYYREHNKSLEYTRYFDVNQLPVGNYRLQIKHPDQMTVFQLTVKRKGDRYSLNKVE
jgi:hypothetical protein